jgi:putative endonuclease
LADVAAGWRRKKGMKKKIKRKDNYYVYIVECKDGTYYTGCTNDLGKRLHEHNGRSRGAKYTRGKGPVKVVWVKEYKYLKRAIQEECRIKKLRRYQKEELIYGKDKKF